MHTPFECLKVTTYLAVLEGGRNHADFISPSQEIRCYAFGSHDVKELGRRADVKIWKMIPARKIRER